MARDQIRENPGRPAGWLGRPCGLTPVYIVSVLVSHPPARGHQPWPGVPPTCSLPPGVLPVGTEPLPNMQRMLGQLLQGAGGPGPLPNQQPTCGSSGGTFLFCCFTQVLKINSTLISLTGEKLIEGFFSL